jgi:hypothetical protein
MAFKDLTPDEESKISSLIDCLLKSMEYDSNVQQFSTNKQESYLVIQFPIELYHNFQKINSKLKTL